VQRKLCKTAQQTFIVGVQHNFAIVEQIRKGRYAKQDADNFLQQKCQETSH
jgi:hypothetical protein